MGAVQRSALRLGLRADVNFQFDVQKSDASRLTRLLVSAQSLKHQLGRRTALSALLYHMHGATPLMAAVQSGQHEAAAALISSGAKVDLRNYRNWLAADFARGAAIPSFLQQGFAGDIAECRRLASLALSDGYVEISF